jgi:hypothetical protein
MPQDDAAAGDGRDGAAARGAWMRTRPPWRN